MAFVHSVKDLLPGFYPLTLGLKAEAQTAAIDGTTTFTLTAPTGTTIRQGYWRLKGISYPGGGAGQITAIKVTVTDGSTTVTVGLLGSFAASDLPDVTRPFCLDIGGTSISFAVTMANVVNGQLSLDVEVGANP